MDVPEETSDRLEKVSIQSAPHESGTADDSTEIAIKTPTDGNKNDKDNDKFSFSKVSREKKLLLVCMAFVNFCSSTMFSLLAPFFPKEAERKGASQTTVGLIFGAFQLVMFLTSPIFGNYITRIGSKFMFLSGIAVCGCCAILFGTLDKSPDGDIYIIMCFLCRTVEATGAAAFVTASFAIITHEFPKNVATVIGSLETFSGIGMMVGPTIGSTLYVAGGYGLPFFVMGGLLIGCAMICVPIMPKVDDEHKPFEGSVLTLLKSPLCLVSVLCIVCGSYALGFLDPTLANHLSKLNVSQIAIGFIFLVTPAAYAFTAPVWGWLGDSKGIIRHLIIGGNLLSAVSYLMLGPSEFTPFYPFTIWSSVLALIAIGVFLGCALIPTFQTMFHGARNIGMEDTFDTYGMVSGLFNSSFSLGAFIGPTVGGVLADKYGFPAACSISALLFLLAGILMLGYHLVEKYSNCIPSQSTAENNKDTNCIPSKSTTVDNREVVTERTRLLQA